MTSFAPRTGDKVKHRWYKEGKLQTIDLPPLCLTRLRETRENISRYIEASKGQYIRHIIEDSSEIGSRMLQHAIRYSKKHEVRKLPSRVAGLTFNTNVVTSPASLPAHSVSSP